MNDISRKNINLEPKGTANREAIELTSPLLKKKNKKNAKTA